MSTHSIDESTGAGRPRSAELTRGVWRGVLLGLIPLGLLISMVTVSVLLTALARLLFAEAGFFAQQQAGVAVQANAALWALAVSALLVVGPILLALLLPQHPFP